MAGINKYYGSSFGTLVSGRYLNIIRTLIVIIVHFPGINKLKNITLSIV